MLKSITASFFLLFILLLADFTTFAINPIPLNPTTVIIPEGASFNEVLATLRKKNIVKGKVKIRLLAEILGVTKKIKAGEYLLNSNTNYLQILKLLTSNEQVMQSFTIVEGWTYKQMLERLLQNPYIKKTLDSNIKVQALLNKLGIKTDYKYLEGLYLPSTYNFVRGTKDIDILSVAYAALLKEFDKISQDGINFANLGVKNFYDGLILASIIEKESSILEEYPLISGVYNLRLIKNMRLQACPSVIYGINKMGDSHILTREQIKQDTPYNTYTRLGLPISPICLPSKEALKAAFNPEYKGYLYFVLKSNGQHHFSKSFRQHQVAVKNKKRG